MKKSRLSQFCQFVYLGTQEALYVWTQGIELACCALNYLYIFSLLVYFVT